MNSCISFLQWILGLFICKMLIRPTVAKILKDKWVHRLSAFTVCRTTLWGNVGENQRGAPTCRRNLSSYSGYKALENKNAILVFLFADAFYQKPFLCPENQRTAMCSQESNECHCFALGVGLKWRLLLKYWPPQKHAKSVLTVFHPPSSLQPTLFICQQWPNNVWGNSWLVHTLPSGHYSQGIWQNDLGSKSM